MDKVGMTPKYKMIPQTVEEYKYLLDLVEKSIEVLRSDNSRLRAKVNTLQQKLTRARRVINE